MRLSASLSVLWQASLLSVVSAGGFLSTCDTVQLQRYGYFLGARCAIGNGQWKFTQITWMEECAGNANGIVKCQKNGNALRSCIGCEPYPPKGPAGVKCYCKNKAGKEVESTISMNDCVSNWGGNLGC